MSAFTVTRALNGPRERVWEILTQRSHFESWLPAKPGTAVLDVRTGGSWQATVVSSGGGENALTGRDPRWAGDLGRPVFVRFGRVFCIRPPLTDAERAAEQEEREAGGGRYKEVRAAFRAGSW